MILWALGAVGVGIVAKWLLKEAHRVNDELDAVRARPSGDSVNRQSLERDPQTGVYRPKS